MSPTPASPAAKLTHRTSSQDSHMDGIRKRVCKACDRCRLKKSKCDGSSPCSRCKADNAICVFGERKKSHDKVYPKGYVEMLEQQQSQLVQGLQEMYRRLQQAQGWKGDSLSESNGHPLTHDILAALNLLEAKHDGSGLTEGFEEDVNKLQARLLAEGHGFTQRRGSSSSESEHSQHGRSAATPTLSQPSLFRNSFQLDRNRGSNTASPLVPSPVQNQPQFIPPQRPSIATPTYNNDPSLYAPEWAQALSDAANLQNRAQFLPAQTHSPQNIDDLDMYGAQWSANNSFDGMFSANDAITSSMLMMGSLSQLPDMQNLTGMQGMDGLDVDFGKFVNPSVTTEIFQ